MTESHEKKLAELQAELREAREQLKLLVKAEIRSQSSQLERDRQFARIKALSDLALRATAPDDTHGTLHAAKQLLLTTFDLDGLVSADLSSNGPGRELEAQFHDSSDTEKVVVPRALAAWIASLPTAAVARPSSDSLPQEVLSFLGKHGAVQPISWFVAITLRRHSGTLSVVLIAWKTEGGVRSYHRPPPSEHDLPFLQLLGRHLERALENASLVTDLRRRSIELTEANQRLMASLENLDQTHRRLHEAQKMEALGRLAGGVAHDFNNLLCVILGNASLLAETMPPSPQLDDIRQIIDAAERGREISSQLLALGRRHPEELQALELNELLRSQTRFLSRLLGEMHPVCLELSGEPLWLRGEKGLLERTIMNLVLNARDAMPGGGTIRIGTRRASKTELEPQTESAHIENWILLTVADSGFGMSETTRQRIFEPFFTTKEKGRGTGLGLSVVYGTVNRYGGQILVESAESQGTQFRLFFPAATPGEIASAHPEPRAKLPPSSVRVMVVEDDVVVRELVVRVLESRGYIVVAAANGEEAIQLLPSMPDAPPSLARRCGDAWLCRTKTCRRATTPLAASARPIHVRIHLCGNV